MLGRRLRHLILKKRGEFGNQIKRTPKTKPLQGEQPKIGRTDCKLQPDRHKGRGP